MSQFAPDGPTITSSPIYVALSLLIRTFLVPDSSDDVGVLVGARKSKVSSTEQPLRSVRCPSYVNDFKFLNIFLVESLALAWLLVVAAVATVVMSVEIFVGTVTATPRLDRLLSPEYL